MGRSHRFLLQDFQRRRFRRKDWTNNNLANPNSIDGGINDLTKSLFSKFTTIQPWSFRAKFRKWHQTNLWSPLKYRISRRRNHESEPYHPDELLSLSDFNEIAAIINDNIENHSLNLEEFGDSPIRIRYGVRLA